MLNKWICGTFDIKSNHFGPVIPGEIKSYEKLDKRAIKYENVFLQIDQKLHCYDQISGWRRL